MQVPIVTLLVKLVSNILKTGIIHVCPCELKATKVVPMPAYKRDDLKEVVNVSKILGGCDKGTQNVW